MTYRKTLFSYAIWFLYTGLCIILLAFAGYSVYSVYVKAAPAKLGVLLVFPLLVCIYLALRQGALAIRRRQSLSLHSRQMIEALCVSVAFVFGFLARLGMFRYAQALLTSGDTLTGSYMEKAFVRAGESVEPIAHGVSYLYVLMLSGVFSFLGNSAGAAMLLQIVLQLLTMLLGYFIMKAAAGRFAACLTILFLAFSPVYLERIAVIDPECLFLFLYLFGLLIAVLYVRAVLTDSPLWKQIFMAAVPGVVIGILAFFELSAVTILFFLAVLFVGKRENLQADSRGKDILRFFVAALSCAAAFFLLIGADAAVCGVSLSKSLYVWAYPYLQTGGPVIRLGELYGNVPFCCFLFLPSAFLVFEFFRNGREQDYTPWLFFCILFTPFLIWEFWTVKLSGLALIFWSMTAVFGIKNCLFGGAAEVMQAKIEQINAAAGHVPVSETIAAAGSVQVSETIAAAGRIPASESVSASAEPVTDALPQKPRFLENPLPLPKKHVKKEMDYDYTVAPEMMHFDLEPADGDDFTV